MVAPNPKAAAARLRPAQVADHPGIMALRSRHGMSFVPFEEWSNVYQNNPIFERVERSWTTGWVVERSDGMIVGHLGNIPLRYHLGRTELLAAAMNSWVVDFEYRPFSLYLLRSFFRQAGVDLFLITTANPNSGRALEAIRIKRLPVRECNRSSFWITNHVSFANSLLRKRNWPLPGLLGLPAAFGLAVSTRLQRIQQRPRRKTIEVRFLDRFDEHFDCFWGARRRSGVLLFDRDCRTLNWVFQYALRRRTAWVIAAFEDRRLYAYGIFLRRDQPEIGLQRMRLVDLQFLEPDRCAVAAILEAALEKCTRERIHILEAIGFSRPKREMLKSFSDYRRSTGAWPFYYKAGSPSLAERLEREEAWEACELDGDASLFSTTIS